MPGLVVALGQFPIGRLHAAVQKLVHVSTHRCEVISLSAQLALGWAGPRERVDNRSGGSESGHEVHVWRYGHTFKDGVQPRSIDAAQVLRDYLAAGVEACYDYEGSFVIVIADLRLQRLYVVPDRLCTQPLYYTRSGDGFVIGPEVKALCAAAAMAPALSTDGIIGFLCAGYDIGARTLFSDVRQVEMGKMLELSIDQPLRLSTRRFWKLEFSSAQRLTDRRDAEDALFESIKAAHRLLLSDQPAFQILLSGGADSRGILATCNVLGARPVKALTWGLLQDVQRSDASIAKLLAERYGVPWDFIVTRTDTFIENCEQWAYVSELSNDNFGWYSEGFGTLRYLDAMGYPCSFIGDESWGWHGFAYDEQHAHSKVLPATVPASLLALLPEGRRQAAASSYVDNIAAVMRDCQDADWTDRKDFLYLHARVSRFIFALGYNRGHVLEQRRPFLTRAVLDVVRRLPAQFRVHKNLYLSMLERRLPETARVAYPSVNSLPDWNYDLRMSARLRDHFLQLLHDPLIGSGSLGAVLDLDRFRALRDAFFAQRPAPVVRRTRASQVIKAHAKEMLWRHPLYKYVDRWTNSRPHDAHPATIPPIDILRRVAILVLLERQLHRFQVSGREPLTDWRRQPDTAASRGA